MGVIGYRLRCLSRRTWSVSAALALIVAVAVGCVLVLAGGATRTLTAPDRYVATRGVTTDALVEQQATGGPMTEQIEALPSVESVRSATFVFGGLVPERGGDRLDTLVFAGSHEAFGTRMISGREPSGMNEFSVSARFVESSGARLGDRFRLFTVPADRAAESGFSGELPAEPTVDAELVGVFTGPTELQDGYALALFPASLLDLGDAVGTAATQHAVALAPGATIDELRSDLDRLAVDQPFGIDPAEVVPAAVRDAVTARGLGISVVAAILGLAVVAVLGQLLARQFRLNDAQSLALRAIGMSPRQLIADPVARATVPVVAGLALAAVGAYLASGTFPLGFVDAIEPRPGLRFEPVVHLAGAVLVGAVLVTWVAGTLAVQSRRGRAARPSPLVDTLARRVVPTSTSTGVRFALTRPAGDGGSPAWALSGLVVVLGGVVAALVFGATVSRTVDDRGRQGQADIIVGQGGNVADESAVKALVESPAVAAVARAATLLVSVGPDALDLLALDPERGTIVPDVLVGRLPVGPDEIVLGRVSARKLGVEVGDSLSVRVQDDQASQQRSFTVTGLAVIPSVDSVDGLGVGGMVTRDAMSVLAPGAAFPTVLANLVPGAPTAEVEQLREAVDGGPGDPSAAIVNLDRIRSFPFVVAATLGGLAVLSLAHQLISSARNRRRDVAVLKALGAGQRWVSSVVHSQAMAAALAAGVLGIPLGIGVGRWVVGVFIDRIGARADALVSWSLLGMVAAVLIVLTNVVAAVPARRVRRQRLPGLLSQE